MSLKSYIQEVERIDIEIKRLSCSLKKLRKQKKIAEENIIRLLKDSDQPGVKYKNNAILVKPKKKKIRKTKNQKNNDILNVLYSLNVSQPEEALQKILEANSGIEEMSDHLQFKKLS